jgi:transcriptional regulator with XRE-family HTH domain
MTPAEYKALRQRLGTQAAIAARLGVARSTVAHRERGAMPITIEAGLALLGLGRANPATAKAHRMAQRPAHR